jgi:hypothetical protein
MAHRKAERCTQRAQCSVTAKSGTGSVCGWFQCVFFNVHEMNTYLMGQLLIELHCFKFLTPVYGLQMAILLLLLTFLMEIMAPGIPHS